MTHPIEHFTPTVEGSGPATFGPPYHRPIRTRWPGHGLPRKDRMTDTEKEEQAQRTACSLSVIGIEGILRSYRAQLAGLDGLEPTDDVPANAARATTRAWLHDRIETAERALEIRKNSTVKGNTP